MHSTLARLVSVLILGFAAIAPAGTAWGQAVCGTWSPLESGMSNTVSALAVFDDGSGPALYAGGSFTTAGGVEVNNIARWDGSAWTPLGSGMNGSVWALTVFDDGSGPALYAGGTFTTAGGVSANRIARWDGSAWAPLGEGINRLGVTVLTVFDDGSGPALYAGGEFTIAGGMEVNNIALWDGSAWSPLGSGISGPFPSLNALTVYDDRLGTALYAGGQFTIAGGATVNRIARWDGSAWTPLGLGMNGTVSTLVVFDDGAGPALIAGGTFTTAGGVAASRIARWDGSEWSRLSSQIYELFSFVTVLTVFDDGSGPALYAGGNFTSAGGVPANYIARWDGTAWTPLGSGIGGLSPSLRALTAFDDGLGSALYAGGRFASAGGVAANHVASWRLMPGCISLGFTEGSILANGTSEARGEFDSARELFDVHQTTARGFGLTSSGFGDDSAEGEVSLEASSDPVGTGRATIRVRGGGDARAQATGDHGPSEANITIGTLDEFFDDNPIRFEAPEPLYFKIESEMSGSSTSVSLLDSDGRPVAGDRLQPGEYQIHAFLGVSAFVDAGFDSDSARIDWTLTLSRTPFCPADLDGDGELTIFDFLEFQNLFAAGDPRADFDGDGEFTIFDFLVFGNEFADGCD